MHPPILLQLEKRYIPGQEIGRVPHIANATSPNFQFFPIFILISVTMLIKHDRHAVIISQKELGVTTAALDGDERFMLKDHLVLVLFSYGGMHDLGVLSEKCEETAMPRKTKTEYGENVPVGIFMLTAKPGPGPVILVVKQLEGRGHNIPSGIGQPAYMGVGILFQPGGASMETTIGPAQGNFYLPGIGFGYQRETIPHPEEPR